MGVSDSTIRGIVIYWVAIGVFYGARGAARAVKAVGLAFLMLAIVLGYRFAIFLVTLISV